HFNLVDLKFMPRTAVKPEPAIAGPRFCFAQSHHRFVDDIEAYLMRAVRIGEVARGKDLVRLDPLEQLHRSNDIVFKIQLLTVLTPIIEGKVLEMDIFIRQPRETSAGNGLAFADKPLNGKQFCSIYLIGLFV